MFDSSSGDRLKLALKLKGISQKDAAKHADISENSFVNYIKGRRVPPADVLNKISQMCDVETDWVVAGNVNTLLCNAIRDLLLLNDKARMAEDAGVTVPFIEAIRDCNISPSIRLVERLNTKGWGIVCKTKKTDETDSSENEKKISKLEGELKAYKDMYADLLKRLEKKGE